MKKTLMIFCLFSSLVVYSYGNRIALDSVGTLGAVVAAVTSMSCDTGIPHNASTPQMFAGIGLSFANCYGGAVIAHAVKDRMIKQGATGAGICIASIIGMKMNNGTLLYDIAQLRRNLYVSYRNLSSDFSNFTRS